MHSCLSTLGQRRLSDLANVAVYQPAMRRHAEPPTAIQLARHLHRLRLADGQRLLRRRLTWLRRRVRRLVCARHTRDYVIRLRRIPYAIRLTYVLFRPTSQVPTPDGRTNLYRITAPLCFMVRSKGPANTVIYDFTSGEFRSSHVT